MLQICIDMVAGSILPVSWHEGQMYFLFGKECNLEDSAPGWSDFGGGCDTCSQKDTVDERDQKIFDTAVREGVEESTGFLGTEQSIRQTLHRVSKIASSLRKDIPTIAYSECESLNLNGYTVYFMPMQYDANLPLYYNRNHTLLWNKMNRQTLNNTKLFEKEQMEWFTVSDMRKRRSEFRLFYRDILDLVLLRAQLAYFHKFIKRSLNNVKRKTLHRKPKKSKKTKTEKLQTI